MGLGSETDYKLNLVGKQDKRRTRPGGSHGWFVGSFYSHKKSAGIARAKPSTVRINGNERRTIWLSTLRHIYERRRPIPRCWDLEIAPSYPFWQPAVIAHRIVSRVVLDDEFGNSTRRGGHTLSNIFLVRLKHFIPYFSFHTIRSAQKS